MAELLQNVELFSANIPWLESLREKASRDFVLPSAKTEAWKYTKLYSLEADDFVVLPSKFLEEFEEIAQDCDDCNCGCGCGGCSCDKNCYLPLPFDAYQLHFYNGKFVPIYPALPQGVEVITLMQAIVEGKIRSPMARDLADYPFAVLNNAYVEEGLFIFVDKDVVVDRPFVLVNHSNYQENVISNLRNIIILEEGAKLEFLEYYKYSGEEKSRYFNNIVNQIYLGKNSELLHYKLQNEAYKAVHIALNIADVGFGASYNSVCLQQGADLGRNESIVNLLQEYAKTEVNSAYIMNGWAILDTTSDIRHLSPKTYSSQIVKGVVGGEARGVFQGKIHIAPLAIETEGRQQHRAILLSDKAEIDVKPELEIFADNVKCSHGAACGELDKEQLFYMRSRGIGEDQAKKILIDAYLDDVLNRINNLAIRDWLKEQIRG